MSKSNETKRAITYSLLAHINNSKTLTNGQLDIFVPIVKKALATMSKDGDIRGENITEICNVVNSISGITIPIPVLRNILKIIKNTIASEDEKYFDLYKDDGFWIKRFLFSEFDEFVEKSENSIEKIQKLFVKFCKLSKVSVVESDIIKFIEKNVVSLSAYISNNGMSDSQDFSIEAKFVSYFKETDVYDEIRDLFIGAILSSYLYYEPSNLDTETILLLDTNFIVSLLDLNTPESTQTCRQLIEIGVKMGFAFHVLQDTLDETKNLLNYKAENIDNSVVLAYVNKEDICNACKRRKLSRTDLQRISDNLESEIKKVCNITIIPYTEPIKNKAKFSSEYQILKQYRSTEKSALHDAMCIHYVKEKRSNKPIFEFTKAKCWWVNNAVSHDYEEDNISSVIANKQGALPEMIKVDDLLCLLWLSAPSIDANLMAEIGLTSLIASTLNKDLPKARIIKELDENIQKYKSEDISEKDVYLLSVRIANGQIKDIEQINTLATTNRTEFNKRVKEEAERQRIEEDKKARKLDNLMNSLLNEIQTIKDQQQKLRTSYEGKQQVLIAEQAQSEQWKQEALERRKKDRENYIQEQVSKWQWKTWWWIIGVSILFVFVVICNILWPNLLSFISYNSALTWILGLFDGVLIKRIYDKYDISKINEFKRSIDIPKDLQDE